MSSSAFPNEHAPIEVSEGESDRGAGEKRPAVSPHALARCSHPSARELVPYELALRLRVLPLGLIVTGDTKLLSCAAPKDFSHDLEQALRFAVDRPVKLIPIDEDALRRAIYIAYKSSPARLLASAQALAKITPNDAPPRRPSLHPASGDAATFLAELIEYAIARRASDIHLIPARHGGHVKLRIHGELLSHDTPLYSLLSHQQIIARIKVLAELAVAARLRPSDGSFEVAVPGGSVHLRVSIMPTVHGEKAVLRIRGNDEGTSLEALRLDPVVHAMLDQFMDQREGFALFAGPTGSGKSTTLYAMVRHLAAAGLSVVTVEDPVEQYLPDVAQTAVHEPHGLDYVTCLRSIVRQDPDVILVGEIRDQSSAAIAYQAALTGHLMLSTVHARDVFEVLLRLQTLGIDPLTVSQATSLIVCQRLVPALCSRCKVTDVAGSAHLGFPVYRARGCPACGGSGYDGQISVGEALRIDRAVCAKIRERAISPAEMASVLNEANYRSFADSVHDRLRDGLIKWDETHLGASAP